MTSGGQTLDNLSSSINGSSIPLMSATNANSSVSVSSIRMALRIVPRLIDKLLPSRPLRKAAALSSSFTKQTIRLRVARDADSSGWLTTAMLALIAVSPAALRPRPHRLHEPPPVHSRGQFSATDRSRRLNLVSLLSIPEPYRLHKPPPLHSGRQVHSGGLFPATRRSWK